VQQLQHYGNCVFISTPVSEMTYTVSNGTLNSTIPYLFSAGNRNEFFHPGWSPASSVSVTVEPRKLCCHCCSIPAESAPFNQSINQFICQNLGNITRTREQNEQDSKDNDIPSFLSAAAVYRVDQRCVYVRTWYLYYY